MIDKNSLSSEKEYIFKNGSNSQFCKFIREENGIFFFKIMESNIEMPLPKALLANIYDADSNDAEDVLIEAIANDINVKQQLFNKKVAEFNMKMAQLKAMQATERMKEENN